MLAIVQALKAFRYYIYGRHFNLYTDHKALTFLFTAKDPSYMLLNWMEELLSYQFTIHHRPGVGMILPDALSRLYADHRKRMEEPAGEGEEQPVMTSCSVAAVHIEGRCNVCKQRVPKRCDKNLCKVHCIGCVAHPTIASPSLVDDDAERVIGHVAQLDPIGPERVNSMHDEFVKYVLEKKEPVTEVEKRELVERYHHASHQGTEQLFITLFRKGWYWREMKKMCATIAQGCQRCLQYSVVRKGYHPLTPITASLPFDHIAMDLGQVITTSAAGSNFFLVVTDVCTRFTILRALPNKAALTVARELYKIVADFGLPKVIQSDNGAEFVNTVIREMKEQLGFQHRTISAYHPQANGAAEVNVGMAKRMLKKFTHGDLSCWCLYLPAVQLSMNVRVTKRHHSTPFSLIFNRPANIYEDYSGTKSKPLTIDEMIRRNDLMTHLLFPAIGAATDSHNSQLVEDFKISHRILADGYPKGALVMKVVDIGGSKMEPSYEGPFKVLEKTSKGTYYLLDQTDALYPRPVPPSHLKLVSVPDYCLEDDTHYEVERIISHRGPTSKREYLVKWKHFPSSQNQWVAAQDFDAPQIIAHYWKQRRVKG